MPPDDEELERLQTENERLREQNQALEEERASGHHRARRISAWVVLVVACLLAVVSVLVVFVRNEVLNTDTYVSTVQPLASNPAIQAAVATRVSNNIIDQGDIKQRVQNALPDQLDVFAGPLTAGIQQAVHQATLTVVQSDAFARLWTAVNRDAHRQMVNLVTGNDSGAVASSGHGEVTLDLSKVADQVKTQLNNQGITLLNKVNTSKAPTLTLFQSNQLAKVQRLVRFLNHLALVLPILTVLLFVGAVLLARNHRKGFLRVALGLAVSMVLVLLAFDFGRNQYLNALPRTASQAAASAAYDIVTATPLRTVRIILVISVIAALITLAVGNSWLRAKAAEVRTPEWLEDSPVRRFVTAHRGALQWVTVGVGALILVVWDNPTPLVVVIVVLLVLAVVALVAALGGGREAGAPAVTAADGGDRPAPA